MPSPFGFLGMTEQDLESIYNLLSMTPRNMNPEFDSKGSYHLLRECNMLHLSKDGAAMAGATEDNAYLIPCTPGEQAKYD
jgi:hypothetical protein